MAGSFSTTVDSSNLHSVVYDSLGRSLLVKFTSKACYRYLDVPIGIAKALVAAGSAGTYLNREVKRAFEVQPISESFFKEEFDRLSRTLNVVAINWALVAGDGSIPVFPR
ncbi:KTSC domain-containing protein [Polaromonas sp. JS666]|uniref:KTSC domain-containing protein n=1 Tax=Polaromonas sp. (strain JS666 / ATCC BAA-500) TaxID=296591 RepID=UPI0000534997|nr:KTSC domain-containing protein [Polaromonas sp. JS666]ABE47352.1 hypothetical protein Bpro_5498 [Polaromonas sp. JS666]